MTCLFRNRIEDANTDYYVRPLTSNSCIVKVETRGDGRLWINLCNKKVYVVSKKNRLIRADLRSVSN